MWYRSGLSDSISMPVLNSHNNSVHPSLIGNERSLGIKISDDLLINVSSHAIELSPASRDEISDMSNIMDLAMPLELGTSEFSHF